MFFTLSVFLSKPWHDIFPSFSVESCTYLYVSETSLLLSLNLLGKFQLQSFDSAFPHLHPLASSIFLELQIWDLVQTYSMCESLLFLRGGQFLVCMSLKNVADIWLWTISCGGRFWPWPGPVGRMLRKLSGRRRWGVREGKGAAIGQVLQDQVFRKALTFGIFATEIKCRWWTQRYDLIYSWWIEMLNCLVLYLMI